MLSGKLVCNLWTDLIGPSVFLAEITSLLASHLYDLRKDTIKVLDLFSGSGAVAVAILNAFYRREEKLSIVCVDKNTIPFPKDLIHRVTRLRTDIFELIGRNSSFFKQYFDLVIADPPHYLTLDLLYKYAHEEEVKYAYEEKVDRSQQYQNPKPFLQFLSDTKSFLALYYAHKEQERLSFFIIRRLGMFWPQVYNLRIADEKIAICAPEHNGNMDFKKYFKELKTILKRDYDISDILVLDKYYNRILEEDI